MPAVTNPNVCEYLESLIDSNGLLHVLIALECICDEKADHIRTNWQDKTTARTWANAAKVCGKAARSTAIEIVS